MQDGVCEEDEAIKKLGEDIPSFKKKTTLDPWTHNQFFVLTGDQGDKMMDAIVTAVSESGAFDKILATQLAAALTLLSLY